MSDNSSEINKGKKPSTDVDTVTLSGDLTIQMISEVKEQILKFIKSGNKFGIHLKNVESIDLAFMQFLFSVLASSKKDGLVLFIILAIKEESKILLENSGLLQILKSNKEFNLLSDETGHA